MKPRVTPFLMFDGKAEDAMNFYVSVFEDAKINSIQRYGPGEMGAEGSVMRAAFELGGQEFMCIDTPMKHDFTFTPALSLFVNFDGDAEITEAYLKLSQAGQVFMPLGEYPFSRKYGWVADKFGVAWQLNLRHAATGKG